MVVFRQLDRTSIRHIADLVLADTAAQLAKKNIKLEVAPAVMAKIVEQGYDQVIQVCTMLAIQDSRLKGASSASVESHGCAARTRDHVAHANLT